MTANAREPRKRTMLEFAEQEFVVPPGGPWTGRFRPDRQPFTRLLLEEIDSGRWSTINVTAPVQCSKTTVAFIIPTLYYLFELREPVICGLPDMALAADKWGKILLPAIRKTRFAAELPTIGDGSREGKHVRDVAFKNGAWLRFMSAGGGDAALASVTSRVLVITETDKMDEPSPESRETDRVSQMIARTSAFDARAVVFMECTTTTEMGRTWQNHLQGTQSRIALPCPHCEQWVIPTDTPADRDLLTGWREAKDAEEARELGAFACPHCGAKWTEAERAAANRRGVLIHKGQTIERKAETRKRGNPETRTPAFKPGEPAPHECGGSETQQRGNTGTEEVVPIPGTDWVILGPRPRTRMLSFRASAINNLMRGAGTMAEDEWKAARKLDEESAARDIYHFLWALPHKPDLNPLTPLDREALMERVGLWGQNIVPDDALQVTAGIDIGKHLAHFVILATRPTGTHIVNYGTLKIDADSLSIDRLTLAALRRFRDEVWKAGWPMASGGTMSCEQVWIDVGYSESKGAVLAFCRETREQLKGDVFRPLLGRGETGSSERRYTRPTKSGNVVHFVGEEYHISWIRADLIHVVEVNVDHYKTVVHDAFAVAVDAIGSMTLFRVDTTKEHDWFTKQITSEEMEEGIVPGKGMVRTWKRKGSTANHWLDALVYARAAANFAAVILERRKLAKNAPRDSGGMTTPDGRPFLVTTR